MKSPKVHSFKTELFVEGIPEITDINYDVWRLNATLKFKNPDHPVYIYFENIIGFRVLDEGDLLEFWDKELRADGWLWEVQEGGWSDLEKQRSGFRPGMKKDYIEYLILGETDCLSVLCYGKPVISITE